MVKASPSWLGRSFAMSFGTERSNRCGSVTPMARDLWAVLLVAGHAISRVELGGRSALRGSVNFDFGWASFAAFSSAP